MRLSSVSSSPVTIVRDDVKIVLHHPQSPGVQRALPKVERFIDELAPSLRARLPTVELRTDPLRGLPWASASASRAGMTLWRLDDPSSRFWEPHDGWRRLLEHEFAHVVGRSGGPPEPDAWRAAVLLDTSHLASITSRDGVLKLSPTAVLEEVRLQGGGVTEYANSVDSPEDWAEAYALSQASAREGYLAISADGRRFAFADLFPNRARELARQFPPI